MRCGDVAPALVFYACNEVSEHERARIEQHLAGCADCSQQLARERELWDLIGNAHAENGDSSNVEVLLEQCRSELSENLDDLSAAPDSSAVQRWELFGWVRRWMALRPAWSGAMLICLGVLLGAEVIPWLQDGLGLASNVNPRPMNVLASQKLTDEQLSKMAVAGINLSPYPNAAPGTVQLQLRAEQPMVLSGSADDSNMRRVLTYVVQNGDRFDAGVRLDCLDALRAQARNVQVREALMAAARKDQNPAVRMKALEALRDSSDDDAVREAMLDALTHDSNPGVRVEVVNMLVRSLEHDPQFRADPPFAPMAGVPGNSDDSSDGSTLEPPSESGENSTGPSVQKVIRTLRELQKRDPSSYVRLRSAAALRQIGPQEIH
jgi:hypothetical protein